jgi:hypothetical protein
MGVASYSLRRIGSRLYARRFAVKVGPLHPDGLGSLGGIPTIFLKFIKNIRTFKAGFSGALGRGTHFDRRLAVACRKWLMRGGTSVSRFRRKPGSSSNSLA